MPVGGYVPVPLGPHFDDANLLGGNEDFSQNNENASSAPSKFSLDYYRSYFDVDTYQVIQRSLAGLIPFSKRFSLVASLRPAPDLYGPFWITVTLIFSIAFSGSIYEYIESRNTAAQTTFNFGRVTISAALLFIYWCLLPAILTSAVWFRRRHVSSDIEGSTDEDDFEFSSLFTELLAIYGYSMVAFIPAAVLLCIPASYLQWTLIGVACFISLIVLSSATWSTFKQRRKQLAVGLLVLIVAAHVVMTISLSFVFFHQPTPAVKPAPPFQFPQQPADGKSQDNAPSQESQIHQSKDTPERKPVEPEPPKPL